MHVWSKQNLIETNECLGKFVWKTELKQYGQPDGFLDWYMTHFTLNFHVSQKLHIVS